MTDSLARSVNQTSRTRQSGCPRVSHQVPNARAVRRSQGMDCRSRCWGCSWAVTQRSASSRSIVMLAFSSRPKNSPIWIMTRAAANPTPSTVAAKRDLFVQQHLEGKVNHWTRFAAASRSEMDSICMSRATSASGNPAKSTSRATRVAESESHRSVVSRPRELLPGGGIGRHEERLGGIHRDHRRVDKPGAHGRHHNSLRPQGNPRPSM